MSRLRTLLTVAAASVTAALFLARPRRVEVIGTSMTPTFDPGDRLVVLRAPVRVGDVAVAPDPREPTRSLVKRVVALEDGAITLEGDNPHASTDSRAFGRIPVEAVRGRAVYRYHPANRRGRIGRLVP